MDPHAVLGIDPGATLDEATRAYRRLAKRHHPDRTGAGAGATMSELNVAYELLRSAARRPREAAAPDRRAAARPSPGQWLPDAIRRALGGELVGALEPDERVELVTPASTWASPTTLLAVTDRRLLWLLDDAVSNRVRFLRFRDTRTVEQRPSWPRRRRARLRVQPRYERSWTFGDLRPSTAAAIVGLVRAALPATR